MFGQSNFFSYLCIIKQIIGDKEYGKMGKSVGFAQKESKRM